MGVKSVIDIEVDDAAFKRFSTMFQKYQEQVKKAGPEWEKLNEKVEGTSSNFTDIVHALYTWEQLQKRLNKLENDQEHTTHRTMLNWQAIGRTTKNVALNLADAAKSIIRWTAVGGLLGVGSLYGLDRLAGSVSGNRRASLGLGIGYGQRQAFNVNYGRVVDSDRLLSGVNESLSDVTKRYSLYGAGFGESELAGKDTGQVSAALIDKLKDLADKTPRNLLGQVIQARGLGQFTDLEGMLRLKNTSREELAGYAKHYDEDQTKLGLTEDTQRKWQDFFVQLDRASDRLQNVLVKGLDKLIPTITGLSDDLADFLDKFTDSPQFAEWIDSFKSGLQYLGSKDFKDNVTAFVTDVGKLGSGIHWLLQLFPKSIVAAGAGAYAGSKVGGLPGAAVGAGAGVILSNINPDQAALESSDPDSFWWRNKKTSDVPFRGLVQKPSTAPYRGLVQKPSGQVNLNRSFNVGNIRNVNGGFMEYGSQEEGISAIAKLLLHGKYFKGKNTIREIEETYAPRGENDTERLIRDMVKNTGFGADQKLDKNDQGVLATIISALTRQEGTVKGGVSKEVVIRVLNQTGGSATISMANAAR